MTIQITLDLTMENLEMLKAFLGDTKADIKVSPPITPFITPVITPVTQTITAPVEVPKQPQTVSVITPTATATAKAYTIEDLRKRGVEINKTGETGKAYMSQLLDKYNAAKLSDLSLNHYPAFYADMEAYNG